MDEDHLRLGRDGIARLASYTCRRQDGWGNGTHTVVVPARLIDHAIVERALAILGEVDRETALAIVEGARLEQKLLERSQQRRLLDAEADLDRLRQFMLSLPPEMRHAQIDATKQYEAAAKLQQTLQTQIGMMQVPATPMTSAEVDELVALTRDVRRLWDASDRTPEERKQLLHAVVEEIVVLHADRASAEVDIVWKGGVRDRQRVLRARGLEATVRDLTLAGSPPQDIVDTLNASGAITESGRPVSANLVHQKLGHLGLRLREERRVASDTIREGLLRGQPRPAIRHLLDERAPRLGPWTPQRLSDEIRRLKKRTRTGPAPLPSVLPAQSEKQHVLAHIADGLRRGENWNDISTALNATGLRPPRGKGFPPTGIRLLTCVRTS